jgi:cell wall-associated NlpC family hydrolase
MPFTTPAYYPRHRAERTPLISAHRLRTVAAPAVGLVLTGALLATAPAATASVPHGGGVVVPNANPEPPYASRVMRVAASEAGTPYRYGGTTPAGFDCSGYTQWVYAQVGRSLPRTSAAQAGAVRRVSAADARPGDLVFFTSGGSVYHVGIYAGISSGRRTLWHSPQPGDAVSRVALWTDSVFYGRLGD